jgi:hypothetical protein
MRNNPGYLHEIASHFAFGGNVLEVSPYGFGHINDTYQVRSKLSDQNEQRYILQRINHLVFKNPAAVMHNLIKVTQHLHRKIAQSGGDPRRETIHVIPTQQGDSFYTSPENEAWRAEFFIEGAQTYQIPTRQEHYYHAAQAFGQFGRLLADFPVDDLYETIPDFHHTPKRFATLVEAIERDAANRVQLVKHEIAFFLAREQDTHVLVDLAASGKIPRRVTHNDTKFENVMIDDLTGEGVCVIDLDTVMPGIILFDFGDTVRSGANPAAEDEPDLSNVNFDLKIFELLTHGYLDAARKILNPIEIDHLAFAARLITLEQGIRFLTDFLNGDVYYRIHRPNHNLNRCWTQIRLVQQMEEHSLEMEKIILRYR